MPMQRTLVDLKDRNLPQSIGNKAAQLRRLLEHGVRLPATLVCTWEAYQCYLENDVDFIEVLRAELVGLDTGSVVADPGVNDYMSRDLRVPAGSAALQMHAYPQGAVPGVTLGELKD